MSPVPTVEIIGTAGHVQYRRPLDHPLVQETKRTLGYSNRVVPTYTLDRGVLWSWSKAITGPDRVLDCLIQLAVFGDQPYGFKGPNNNPQPATLREYVEYYADDTLAVDDAVPDDVVPRFTAQFEAARRLILPDWHVHACHQLADRKFIWWFMLAHNQGAAKGDAYGEHNEIAIALTIAALDVWRRRTP